jgi:hypothetical protein
MTIQLLLPAAAAAAAAAVAVAVAVAVVVVVVVVAAAEPVMSCMHITDTLACKVCVTEEVGLQCVRYYCTACTKCKHACNDHQMKQHNHPAL